MNRTYDGWPVEIASFDVLKKARDKHSLIHLVWSEKEKEPILVDAVTLNMLFTVYDALTSDELKSKFKFMVEYSRVSFVRLVNFGWSCTK